ncbi:alpha/beta hydrolase [Actinopolymorpha sp. NPDC004070]|uniref:alpha/beta fold hydrolase n=1 Tax=Actinopolymorpha sp. NPDC004070 TaxID=3154548 RepID=UPI00339DD150
MIASCRADRKEPDHRSRRRGRRLAPVVLLATLAVLFTTAACGRIAEYASTSRARPAAAPSACAAKPTVVLVHGAWANESSWSGEVRRLQQAGQTVRAVTNPLNGLDSDAASVAAFLKTVSGPIVLVGHSYGGSVITNAAAGNPHVRALVYVDAAAPAPGQSTGQLSGKGSALAGPPGSLYDTVPRTKDPGGATRLYLKENVFRRSFGQDLPASTANVLWAAQRPAAMKAFTTPSSAAAWKKIPSWYVIGTADKIITPQSQQAMARRAHARITYVQGGSHLTLVSHPQAVTRQILAAVDSTCARR